MVTEMTLNKRYDGKMWGMRSYEYKGEVDRKQGSITKLLLGAKRSRYWCNKSMGGWITLWEVEDSKINEVKKHLEQLGIKVTLKDAFN